LQSQLHRRGHQSGSSIQRTEVARTQIFRRVKIGDLAAEWAAKTGRVEKLYRFYSAESLAQVGMQISRRIAERRNDTHARDDDAFSDQFASSHFLKISDALFPPKA